MSSSLTAYTQAVIAVALAVGFPIVLLYGDGSQDALKTYQDALAAIIAFYFAPLAHRRRRHSDRRPHRLAGVFTVPTATSGSSALEEGRHLDGQPLADGSGFAALGDPP
jgi:hypothetical protein